MNEDLKQIPIGHAASARYNGANIDHVNDAGYNMLQKAAMNGHTDEVKFFIDNGANVNKVADFGYTPIYLAAMNGHTDVVNLLINNGANINQANQYGTTPMKIAEQYGHTDVAKLLSEKRNQDIINIKELFNHISDKEKISEKEADVIAKFYLGDIEFKSDSVKQKVITELSKGILEVSEGSKKAGLTGKDMSKLIGRASVRFSSLLQEVDKISAPIVASKIAKNVETSHAIKAIHPESNGHASTSRNPETGAGNRAR